MLLNCGVGEDSWESLNQFWIFVGRTDTEAEVPIPWPPDAKNWLIGKDPDAGKDWKQEQKRPTEDEMVWWHHQVNGHEFEQALGVGDGQGSLVCCSPWGCKDSDTTEWLDWKKDLCWNTALWNLWMKDSLVLEPGNPRAHSLGNYWKSWCARYVHKLLPARYWWFIFVIGVKWKEKV